MQLRVSIIQIMVFSAITAQAQSLPDTIGDRQREANRYLQTMSPRDLFRDASEKAAAALPPEKKQQFQESLAANFDFDALSHAMETAMVQHFTAEELKALADLYDSPVGKSAKIKFGAYMADVGAALQLELNKARAKMHDETQPR